MSDNELMMQVKSGDIDKLGILYERYNRVLFGFFYRLTSNAETSEDLVHNVFMRILKYRKNFKGKGKFTTWMFSIAHNVKIDNYKKQKVMYTTDDISELELIDDQEIYEDIEKKERIRLLHKAIRQLNDKQREILIMSRYHDLKYSEIAEILNSTENNIKIQIFRAIKNLRKNFFKLENK